MWIIRKTDKNSATERLWAFDTNGEASAYNNDGPRGSIHQVVFHDHRAEIKKLHEALAKIETIEGFFADVGAFPSRVEAVPKTAPEFDRTLAMLNAVFKIGREEFKQKLAALDVVTMARCSKIWEAEYEHLKIYENLGDDAWKKYALSETTKPNPSTPPAPEVQQYRARQDGSHWAVVGGAHVADFYGPEAEFWAERHAAERSEKPQQQDTPAVMALKYENQNLREELESLKRGRQTQGIENSRLRERNDRLRSLIPDMMYVDKLEKFWAEEK